MIQLRERRVASPAWRVGMIVFGLLSMFSILLGGAAWRNMIQGEQLVNEARNRYVDKIKIVGERGAIRDRNGRPMAMSAPVYSPHIHPRQFRNWAERNPERAAEAIDDVSEHLELDEDVVAAVLARQTGFAYLRHDLTPEDMQDAKAARIPFLRFEKRYRRFYPAAQEAAHVTGFINHEGLGMTGIEHALQEKLQPTDGWKRVLRTQHGEVLEVSEYEPAVDGEDVYLTIDLRLQYIAAVALAQALAKHEARSGSVVLLDAASGDIMALVNLPTFNPNNIDGQPELRRNRAIQDLFEPGSTMKPLLAALALEQELLSPATMLSTAKPLRYGKYTIQDKKIDEDLSLTETIMRSSNVGAVRVAEMLADEDMHEGYSAFGFGGDPLLDLAGETVGSLRAYDSWRPVEKATMAYGYGLSSNLLQLARAYAAFANDGLLPSIGLELDVERPAPRRVISSATVQQVIPMLESVVSTEGTARRAAVSGYRAAGKTGTTHKRQQDAKGYDRDTYQALFVGLAPASNPRFVAAVFVDEPQANGYYGGTVAAPVFAQVMSQALRLYGIPLDARSAEELIATSPARPAPGKRG